MLLVQPVLFYQRLKTDPIGINSLIWQLISFKVGTLLKLSLGCNHVNHDFLANSSSVNILKTWEPKLEFNMTNQSNKVMILSVTGQEMRPRQKINGETIGACIDTATGPSIMNGKLMDELTLRKLIDLPSHEKVSELYAESFNFENLAVGVESTKTEEGRLSRHIRFVIHQFEQSFITCS